MKAKNHFLTNKITTNRKRKADKTLVTTYICIFKLLNVGTDV